MGSWALYEPLAAGLIFELLASFDSLNFSEP
jgi:hypothetical protein